MTSHQPVLATEALAALQIQPAGVYIDCTFGRGGHSREILARLGPRGRLIAMDRDPHAVAAGQALCDARLSVVHARFSRLRSVLKQHDAALVDGVLLDLGVSSPQLDDAERGFSFQQDGELDMRMDPGSGVSAAQWLGQAREEEIGEVIRRYGEERFAKQIARAIVAARSRQPVHRTRQLAQIVAEAVPTREPRQNPATRTFQAIRIYLNQELEELEVTLPQCVEALRVGGRLVVISFHSLEDRIVKRFMRSEAQPEVPRHLPLRAREMPAPRLKLIGRATRPGDAEIRANPRARSAVMRVAERVAA
ncbi:MAG TPA: 16S rRNA (cytosine(1402)-N(4))-methyltransferase RsmH [Burkholderiales bacterium]|jgi:16S rRNA (cytosine1402-N4)-methyltransferase|nr:16S rRNA (cytosine(1402)-N(4))-methyltransferase RsmH [Burkholderiales bacterium]